MREKIRINFKWEDISKYKAEIYGFSILWIMLFHAIVILGLHYTFNGHMVFRILDAFLYGGNMGVETFLFCSGVCLYFSYHRNPDMKCFLTRRFICLFLPVLVINGGYWIVEYLIERGNVARFFSKMTMMDFWLTGDQQIWFVALIFVCYLFYPYLYEYLYKAKFATPWIRLGILLVILCGMILCMEAAYPKRFGRIEIALTRIPSFVLGAFAGKYVYEKKTISGWWYVGALVSFLGTFGVLQMHLLDGSWGRWIYMFAGIPVILLLVGLFHICSWGWLRKFFAFFGNISLELYISHVMVIRVYRETPFYQHCRLAHYAVILVISTLIAWVASELITWIIKPRRK